MRVLEIKIHNYKSICSEIKECRLKLDKKMTFLIGANESGKTNILEAMNKFSAGGFSENDIPYKSKWCGYANPPNNLEMISVTYEVEKDDQETLTNIHSALEFEGEITLTRYYDGSVKVTSPGIEVQKDVNEYLVQLKKSSEDYASKLRKYTKKYKKVNRGTASSTRSVLLRLNVLQDNVTELNKSSNKSQVSKNIKKLNNLYAAIEQLPSNLDTVGDEVLNPLLEIKACIEALPNYINGKQVSNKLWEIVPKFEFVPADPRLWLVGEYIVGEIVNNPENDEKLMSVRRLLSLANLDLNVTRNLRDLIQSRALEDAGHRVTEVIKSVWEQEKDIQISLEWHPVEGNKKLLVMVESEGHRGFPQDRSLGFRWFLEFYLSYATAQSHNTVILFEEPGIHLHPSAQESLKSVMRDRVGEQSQIVYTTHLSGMYDAVHPEGCRAVVKDCGVTKLDEIYSPEHQYTTWEVALRALGIDSPILRMYRRNIITEGAADWVYLLTFGRILAEKNSGFNDVASGLVHIFPGHGASKIPAIVPFFFQPGVKSVVLLDSDQAGEHAREELKRRYGCPNDSITKIVMVNDVQNIEPILSAGEHELEDLFGIDYYASIVSSWLGKSKISKSDFTSANLIASQSADIVGRKFNKKFRKDDVAWHFLSLVDSGNTNIPDEVIERFEDILKQLIGGF